MGYQRVIYATGTKGLLDIESRYLKNYTHVNKHMFGKETIIINTYNYACKVGVFTHGVGSIWLDDIDDVEVVWTEDEDKVIIRVNQDFIKPNE